MSGDVINVTSNGQTGGITAGTVNYDAAPEPMIFETQPADLGAILAEAARQRSWSYHKPFHAGKRLIKGVGGGDDPFFAYNAVPYGHHPLQYGKHRLIRPFDVDSGEWGRPMRLEEFVRRGRKDIRKRFTTALGRLRAHQTMTAVECLRVGQSVYFYFWCWGTLAKRIK